MASKIIGRTACPLCAFPAAHVKESERCTFLYCPECGCQLHTKNERQAELLRAKMRPDGEATAPAPAPKPAAKAAPAPVPAAAPAEAQPVPVKQPARGGLLGLWAGG